MAQPQLPTLEDIAKLPQWAWIKFAARCADRALPLFEKHWPDAPRNHVEGVTRVVKTVKWQANGPESVSAVACAADDDAYAEHYAEAAYAASAAAARAHVPLAALAALAAHDAAHAAVAARAAYRAAVLAAEAGVQVPLIAADFQYILTPAARGGGNDGPSAPPDVLEPESPEASPSWQEVNETLNAVAAPLILQEARRNEDQALRRNYPGEYVAYLDNWEPPVLRREVLAHNRSLKAVHAALASLPERELEKVEVAYCDEPTDSGSYRGGYDRLTLPQWEGDSPRPKV